jgi:isoaspartyl peptidase/L-asparaginase-like protein (Ntn-hydrolase superfamily)
MPIEIPTRCKPMLVCHAGSASNPAYSGATLRACITGLEVIAQNKTSLDAVIAATQILEDDERFNAGTGSNMRLDGSIQMDASCMTGNGAFAAIAAIERVKNPIAVARHILDTPHILLVADGATAFARRHGFEDYDPTTKGAQERLNKVISAAGEQVGEWARSDLEESWNYKTPLREILGSDTVGSVAWDGHGFAAALSSGGITAMLRGRVGDVPLPGCGLFAGEHGAIAATGDGEYIARAMLAHRAYAELKAGRTPKQVVAWALNQLEYNVDIGIIVINQTSFAGGARHGMAWHGQNAKTP